VDYFGLEELTQKLKLPSLSMRTVVRSYETIEDNVCHLAAQERKSKKALCDFVY